MKFLPGEHVFTFELHEITGGVQLPSPPKMPTWPRLKQQLASQDHSSWSYVTRVRTETVQAEERVRSELTNIKDYLQPLVMFGIFLVAVNILGVAIAVIVSVRDTPEASVPSWVTGWGWMCQGRRQNVPPGRRKSVPLGGWTVVTWEAR